LPRKLPAATSLPVLYSELEAARGDLTEHPSYGRALALQRTRRQIDAAVQKNRDRFRIIECTPSPISMQIGKPDPRSI